MNTKIFAGLALALLVVGCFDGSKRKNGVAIMQVDYNGDGVINSVNTLTYRNKNGQLRKQEIDFTDENSEDQIATHTYDSNGFEVRQETVNASDGAISFAIDMTNDERGNVTVLSYDFDGDGVGDQIHYKDYSDDDDVTREAYDYNGDGVIQRERLYTFASPGQFLTRQFDDNGNGVFEYVEQAVYNVDMRRETGFLKDRNGDGTWDEEYFVTWTDNPDGTITRLVERDTDMSGSINRTDTRIMFTDDMREYAQKSFSLVRDSNNDGSPNEILTQTFNSMDQVLTYEHDYNGDGNINFRIENEYNDDGNVTALRYFNASNTLIYAMTVEYKHWRVGQVVLPSEGAGT
ncbi:MAG: hypothetical protein ACR2QT_10215 [Woeseiaceae bacterium]